MNKYDQLLIKNCNVIDLINEKIMNEYDVLIKGGEIVEIGKKINSSNILKVLDGSDKYLLPSLIDSHTHIEFVDTLLFYLSCGITTVVNMCGMPIHLRWAKEIADGIRIGPDIISAGPIIDGTEKYHCSFQLREMEAIDADRQFDGLLAYPGMIVAKDDATARLAVRYTKTAGYDYVKYYNHMNLEAHNAVFDEAKKLGIDVIGHYGDCINSDCISKLSADDYDISQRTVSHIVFVNNQNIQKMLSSGVYLDPTLIVEQTHFGSIQDNTNYKEQLSLLNTAIKEKWVESNRLHALSYQGDHVKHRIKRRGQEYYYKAIFEYQKAGGKIIAGTDSGMEYMLPGWSLHQELLNYVDAGLTSWQALRTATINAAECFRLESKMGSIQVGKKARMMLIDKNPIENLSNISRICMIFKDDMLIDKLYLDECIDKARNKPVEMLESIYK